MMTKYSYRAKGICASEIHLQMEKEIIKSIKFVGGCNGNLKGIAVLCKEKKASDVIQQLQGITCNNKRTSCPDQLTKALKNYLIENNL